MVSLDAYYLVNAGFTYARPSDQRLVFHAALRHESFPEEDFYGFGRDARDADHTAYWRQSFDSIGGVTFSPAPTVHITGTAGVLNVRMLSGREGKLPSTEDRFTESEVPGLAPGVWDNYLHAGAGVDIDRTDDLAFPKGGRYRGSFTRYTGLGKDLGLFSRIDIDIREYLPVPHTKNHVLAMRGLLGSVSGQDAATVPFYFLPRLGGALTLRGYDTSRFTDRDALAFNIEYRVLIKNRLQVLAFTDMGDVAQRLTDLRPTKFHTSQGVGTRFHAGGTFLPGIDFAHGTDGWAVIARLGHAF
jgi:outer membrane protein assembly factor BamA